jgi:hypothetical protein
MIVSLETTASGGCERLDHGHAQEAECHRHDRAVRRDDAVHL